MSLSNNAPRWIGRRSTALLAWPLLLASTATVTFSFDPIAAFGFVQAGQDGSNGTAGDPASDGEDGTDGQAVDWQIQSTDDFVITANRGGDGGHGGTGVDGDDSDSVAQGGNGGNGGNASTLHVWNTAEQAGMVRSNVVLHGDVGGEGGRGGLSVGLLNGQGGHGGSAGDVSADLFVNRSFTLHADGGLGGDGHGYQKQSGSGGDVLVALQLLDGPYQAVDSSIYLRHYLTGGSGGFGREWADGGDAGDVVMSAPAVSQEIVSSKPFFAYDLKGGRGGDTLGGTAGTGGDVFFQAPSWQLGGDGTPTLARFDFQMAGGAGGNSFLLNGRSGAAGNGGSVGMSDEPNQPILVRGGQVEWLAQLSGGNGGRSNDVGRGGDGGTVDFTNLQFNTNGTVAGDQQSIYARVHLKGGVGGSSTAGQGGDGGSIKYVAPTFAWDTAGSVDAYFTAAGGNGGAGVSGGNGGDSEFEILGTLLTNSTSLEVAPAGTLDLAFSAYGGYGFDGGRGGNARSVVREMGASNITVKTLALAGQSVNGEAGTAEAEAYATRVGEGNEEFTKAYARSGARVSQGGASQFGTSANSTAVANSSSGLYADAEAIAQGGYGTHASGDARSLAIGQTAGNQTARARSQSVALGVGPVASDYSRVARAESVSQSEMGHAFATAESTSYGQHSLSGAVASGSGWSHNASATAKTATTARVHSAVVTTTSENLNNVDMQESFGVASEVYFRRTEAMPLVSSTNETRVWVSSGLESLGSFGDYGVSEAFDLNDSTNDVFASGQLSFHGENILVNSDLEIVQEVQGWETDHSLSLFLYGVDYSGDADASLDFLLEVNDQVLIDQSWDSLDLAVADLDNFLFQWNDELMAGDLLTTRWQATLSNESEPSGFTLNMGLVGFASSDGVANFSAVPEPGSSVVLLAAAGLSLITRRRRR